MKCLPGVTTNPNCRLCGSKGDITGFIYPMVFLTCSGCGFEWKTLGAICPQCKESNGTPYVSECPKCTRRKAG